MMLNKNKWIGYLLFWIIACHAADVLAQTTTDYSRYLIKPEVNGGKRPLELDDLKGSWLNPQFGHFAAISRDGQYCVYTITGPKAEATLIQSTESGKKYNLTGIKKGFFSADNLHYVYQTGDSLCYMALKDGTATVQKNVAEYQVRSGNAWVLVRFKDNSAQLKNYLTGASFQFDKVSKAMLYYYNDWFTCQLDNRDKEFITVNLKTGTLQRYKNVFDYGFDQSNQVLILQTEYGSAKSLVWADALSGEMTSVWSGAKGDSRCIGNYQVDKSKQQLVFTLKAAPASTEIQSLWYYKKGMKAAVERKIGFAEARFSGLKVLQAPEFSSDGRYLIFSIAKPGTDFPKAKADAVQVDVWNYQDTLLMSAQVCVKNGTTNFWESKTVYQFSAPVEGNAKLKFLSGEYEQLSIATGEYVLIQKRVPTDRFWEPLMNTERVLVSLKDGKQVSLKKGIKSFWTSPGGTWLLCYDSGTGQYLRFDVQQGQYRDLSGGEKRYFGGEDKYNYAELQPDLQRGIVGWLDEGKYILVYDHYDIWKLDVSGKQKAVNLTNGRKSNIRFEVIKDNSDQTPLNSASTITLTSWNMDTMDNAIYTLVLDDKSKPEKQFGGAHMFYLGSLKYGQSFLGEHSTGRKPLKALDAKVWLLLRQSATEAPNYYVVRGGSKEMKPLTAVQPHAEYNWLSSSLHDFKQVDGNMGKGVFYKPENFDPSKKYPVLILYYDQFSTSLNQYPVLEYISSAHINIPWFVSRGYLVFLPDIYFNKGVEGGSDEKELKIPTGESALNAVEGAASWLSKLPYVDSTKLGITGHSTGGGFTNYILTHSNRFAAVFEGAGTSNWISSALQLTKIHGTSRLGAYNGSDIWTNPEKYLDNPILHVGKVTSPLLIFHCKEDSAVPFEQAVEMFVAMRRMGKKAWLLQYDQGLHTTMKIRDAEDLTIRATQFFDHYLKGAPAPIWMTRGVRAELKGIQTGYEFDPEIKTPPDAKFIK